MHFVNNYTYRLYYILLIYFKNVESEQYYPFLERVLNPDSLHFVPTCDLPESSGTVDARRGCEWGRRGDAGAGSQCRRGAAGSVCVPCNSGRLYYADLTTHVHVVAPTHVQLQVLIIIIHTIII